jgi:hypothetical protein
MARETALDVGGLGVEVFGMTCPAVLVILDNRFSPHFYNIDAELLRLLELL